MGKRIEDGIGRGRGLRTGGTRYSGNKRSASYRQARDVFPDAGSGAPSAQPKKERKTEDDDASSNFVKAAEKKKKGVADVPRRFESEEEESLFGKACVERGCQCKC